MKTKNWIRNFFGGISLAAVLFVFQACYGTPQDFGLDILLTGQVKSATTGLPLADVKITVANNNQYEVTDADGKFSFYTVSDKEIKLNFLSEDASLSPFDTTLSTNRDQVFMEIKLREE